MAGVVGAGIPVGHFCGVAAVIRVHLEKIDGISGFGEVGHAGGVGGDAIGSGAGNAFRKLRDRGLIGVASDGRRDHRHRRLIAVVIGGELGARGQELRHRDAVRDRQVSLRGLELLQERASGDVAEDIDFVEIHGLPEIHAVIAHVARFDHGIPAQLPLEPECPALDILGLDAGIPILYALAALHGQRETGIGEAGVNAAGHHRRVSSIAEEHTARRKDGRIGGGCSAGAEAAALIARPDAFQQADSLT